MITTRAATAKDVGTWRSLRRDGIARYPSDFILTLEEHDASSEAGDAKRLSDGTRFLAYDGDTPIGLCGLNQRSLPRENHRADVGPFYVIPPSQGSGAAKALMEAVFERARALGIWQLELTANEDNARAQAFYQRMGFHRVGRIPNAVLGADGPEHDLLFVLYLPPS